MSVFTEHGPDCSPLVPCGACEIVAFLKTKMSQDDFTTLVELVSDYEDQAPSKRVYKRRERHETPERDAS